MEAQCSLYEAVEKEGEEEKATLMKRNKNMVYSHERVMVITGMNKNQKLNRQEEKLKL